MKFSFPFPRFFPNMRIKSEEANANLRALVDKMNMLHPDNLAYPFIAEGSVGTDAKPSGEAHDITLIGSAWGGTATAVWRFDGEKATLYMNGTERLSIDRDGNLLINGAEPEVAKPVARTIFTTVTETATKPMLIVKATSDVTLQNITTGQTGESIMVIPGQEWKATPAGTATIVLVGE